MKYGEGVETLDELLKRKRTSAKALEGKIPKGTKCYYERYEGALIVPLLPGANLRGVDLSGADLSWSKLYRASLSGVDLSGANLYRADLRGTNLYASNLGGADLRWADLSCADLSWVDLRGANLSGAILTGTCLDPANKPNGEHKGFDVLQDAEGEYVIGYRTPNSWAIDPEYCYTPGVHVAPYFSTCSVTACHPGLYFRSEKKEDDIQVKCYIKDMHQVGDKTRCRKFEVLPD